MIYAAAAVAIYNFVTTELNWSPAGAIITLAVIGVVDHELRKPTTENNQPVQVAPVKPDAAVENGEFLDLPI